MGTELIIKEFSDNTNSIDGLKELIHYTVKTCYPSCYPQEVVDFFIDYHSTSELLKKASEGKLLLAYWNGKLVSCGYLYGNEVGGIYVHPNYHRRGFGNKVLSHLLIEAKRIKLDHVWLDSTPIAYEMYLKAGFKLVEEKLMRVANDAPLDYFHMRMDLI